MNVNPYTISMLSLLGLVWHKAKSAENPVKIKFMIVTIMRFI